MSKTKMIKNNMTSSLGYLAVIAITMFVGACKEMSLSDNSVMQVKTMQSDTMHLHWPMFSGPTGTGQVTSEFTVPKNWSVRDNKNILWKTQLPAGGQSGISVWGEDVFFTINKPLATPRYETLLVNQEQTKLAYQTQYKKVIKIIENDAKYQNLVMNVAKSKDNWASYLEQYKQTKLKKLSGIKLKRAIKKITRESPIANAVTLATQAHEDYIHQQSPQLLNAYKQYVSAQKQLTAKGTGKDIILYCVSAIDGKVKWQRTIPGVVETMYNYAFSDATSPTPVTDGKQVWVVNAAGGMASFTMSGEELWSKSWKPTTGRPFNKQYDTLMADDLIFNVQPPLENDPIRNALWNYVHAINKYTGETQWVSTEALTHYNTPMLGKTQTGEQAIMIGRGGPHGVPEKSEGLSLLNLHGEAIWNWQANTDGLEPWGATDIQIWNEERALWIAGKSKQQLYSIDTQTGQTQRQYDLSQVSRYVYNEQTETHQLQEKQKLAFERQPYTVVLIDDAVYYLVRYEPFIGYLNLATGEHLQLEIPTEVSRGIASENEFVWKKTHKTDQLNSRGQRHNTESRSQGDGTQKAFLASPIVVNNNIYFSNAHGLTYVVDTTKPFNDKALVAVNDLGKTGETYSLSSMAYAQGVLFQRSLKAIYAIK